MTDWEGRYQAGDMPWEKGRAAPPLLEVLEKSGPEIFGGGPVLVPGCGLGHDVRVLASLGMPVVGLDLSRKALEFAGTFKKTGAETYETADFFDLAWREERRFSALWEHTCFCAIPPADRDRYAKAAADAILPGGVLAGVFFLNPHDPGEEDAGPPFATTVAELEHRFSRWFTPWQGWVPEVAYPGREGREWIGLFRRNEQA